MPRIQSIRAAAAGPPSPMLPVPATVLMPYGPFAWPNALDASPIANTRAMKIGFILLLFVVRGRDRFANVFQGRYGRVLKLVPESIHRRRIEKRKAPCRHVRMSSQGVC